MTTHNWVTFHANAKRFLDWSHKYKAALTAKNKSKISKAKAEMDDIFKPFFDSALLASESLNRKLLNARTLSKAEMEAEVSDDEITLATLLLDVTRSKRIFELLGLYSRGKILNPESDLKQIVRISQELAEKEKQN